jgi:uncharacterized MnhB-related membrane protein
MVLHLVLVAVFGVLLPWMKGLEFLDPSLITAYACFGALFAGPASIQAFQGGGPQRDGSKSTRPQTIKEALRRLLRSLAYGEALILIFLATGILTVNLTHPGRVRLPLLDVLGETALLGLAAACVVVVGVAWMSLRYSKQTTRNAMRLVYVAMLIGYYYRPLRIPDIALTGAAIGAVITLGLFYLLWREVVPR